MVAPKKKPKKKAEATSSAQAFTVVLEDVRAQFHVFGEALQGLSEKVDAGFKRVDERFAQVDSRLDGIDGRLDGIDGRLDGIDHRLNRLEQDGGLIKTAVLEQRRELATKTSREDVERIVAERMGPAPPA